MNPRPIRPSPHCRVRSRAKLTQPSETLPAPRSAAPQRIVGPTSGLLRRQLLCAMLVLGGIVPAEAVLRAVVQAKHAPANNEVPTGFATVAPPALSESNAARHVERVIQPTGRRTGQPTGAVRSLHRFPRSPCHVRRGRRSTRRTHRSCGQEEGETCHVERWNRTLRQRLGRFVRQTLSFSKCDHLYELAMRLFVHEHNQQPITY